MFVFNERSTKKILTPWGVEVKKCVIELGITQNDVVDHLNRQGFNINKTHFSNLLYGVGVSARQGEIRSINEYLGIPYEEQKGEES